MPCGDELRQLLMEVILLEESYQHCPGSIGVARADTDGAEEHTVTWMPLHEGADSLPEEEQRAVITLVFGANERSAQLERRWKTVEQPLGIAEQGSRIQAANARRRCDQICASNTVRPDHLPSLLTPREQMLVGRVKCVNVRPVSRALADPSKGPLTKPADFLE